MPAKVSKEVEVDQDKETRLSARKKADAVLRVLRGESVDAISRSLKIPAHLVATWRDEFIAAGTHALKVRNTKEPDRRELRAAQAKVGELTMKIEVLEEFFEKKGLQPPPETSRNSW